MHRPCVYSDFLVLARGSSMGCSFILFVGLWVAHGSPMAYPCGVSTATCMGILWMGRHGTPMTTVCKQDTCCDRSGWNVWPKPYHRFTAKATARGVTFGSPVCNAEGSLSRVTAVSLCRLKNFVPFFWRHETFMEWLATLRQINRQTCFFNEV